MVLAKSREGSRLHRAADGVWNGLQEAYRYATRLMPRLSRAQHHDTGLSSSCCVSAYLTGAFCGWAVFSVPAFETVACEALLCDQHRSYDARQKADICMSNANDSIAGRSRHLRNQVVPFTRTVVAVSRYVLVVQPR